MTIRKLIKTAKHTIKRRLRFDPLSRFYKSPVFRQSLKKITKEEVRQIQDELLEQNIYAHVEMTRRRVILKVLRGAESNKKNGWFLNLILFILTIATTSVTGALLQGKDPFLSLENLSSGYPYSFALLSILFVHEMGHYLAARFYNVRVTLPYFIPLLLPAFHPGTMGAFIKMRSAIPGKRALFDIGVAGPIAGFVLSLIFLIVGFQRLPDATTVQTIVNQIHPPGNADAVNLYLGHTFMYDALARLYNAAHLPMNEMYHFPFIFAGWFGLFVTALNLMPIGQLDGGHLTYAMFGDKARKIALAVFALLIGLNFYLISNYNSYIWVLWSVLILFFIRFRHPPTLNDSEKLGVVRIIIGWLSYLIFILCFSPIPFLLT